MSGEKEKKLSLGLSDLARMGERGGVLPQQQHENAGEAETPHQVQQSSVEGPRPVNQVTHH